MKRTKLFEVVFIVSLMATEGSFQTIKVFKTTNNIEKFKDGTGARLVQDVQDFELVDISICLRFFFFAKLDTFNILIYSKQNWDTFASNMVIFGLQDWTIHHEPRISIGLMDTWYDTSILIAWPAMAWHHVCLTYHNNSSVMTVVSNGGRHFKKVTLEHLKKNPTPIPPEFLTNLFIMRASTTEITEENKFWSMFGKITDVNIWNYTMTVEEMNSWTKCNNTGGGGNVVNCEKA